MSGQGVTAADRRGQPGPAAASRYRKSVRWFRSGCVIPMPPLTPLEHRNALVIAGIRMGLIAPVPRKGRP